MLAIECWHASEHDIAQATRRLKALNKGVQPSNPARFIRDAVRALVERHSVRHPGGGPPFKVSAKDARKAVRLVWKGYEADGCRNWFCNMKHALQNCPKLEALRAELGVSARTLQRAMRREEPLCRQVRQAIKRALSAANRDQRSAACSRLLTWPLSWLLRTFWLDAATIYVIPKSQAAFVPPEFQDRVASDPRLPSHISKATKLKFYICVNAVVGPVALVFVTGTTDLDDPVQWLVSWGRGGGGVGRSTGGRSGHTTLGSV